MSIYIYNILSVFVYKFFIKSKKIYITIVSMQLFLILALRDVTVGYDLDNYIAGYNYINTLNFREMLATLKLGHANLIYPFKYESGYVVFNWIVGHLGFDFHSFLIIVAGICITSITIFIYKYSDNVMLSYIIYLGIGGYIYCFSILRQSLALAIVLLSVTYILDEKYYRAMMFIILAVTFHITAILFIPLLILRKFKITNKLYRIYLYVVVLIFLSSYQLYSRVILPFLNSIGDQRYTHLNFQINNMMIVLLFLSGIIYFFVKDKFYNNTKNNFMLAAFSMATLYEIFGLYNDGLARGIIYYMIFSIIVIPNTIEEYLYRSYKLGYDAKNIGLQKKIIYFVILIIMLGLMYISMKYTPMNPYKIY
ncbi:EpsG family protein [Ligilactobacillus ceti]|uniref:EpsG family protein n=1 Tax=Ligilactobacillus ceti DSM 22408 TaxID=1122146 RepID=A0A0R2KL02_9LACO|nr:EpsG family protein [Ligilactobacillus ceti]KRN88438.1 hypothetical protein IV53_GL000402 [Ligilactobacillus ceti DSM 22408]